MTKPIAKNNVPHPTDRSTTGHSSKLFDTSEIITVRHFRITLVYWFSFYALRLFWKIFNFFNLMATIIFYVFNSRDMSIYIIMQPLIHN